MSIDDLVPQAPRCEGKDALIKALNEHNEARWEREAGEALLDSPRLPPGMAASEKIGSWHMEANEDRWVPLTPEELEAIVEEAVRGENKYIETLMNEEPSVVGILEPVTKEYFTCYRCSAASRCPYTFDPYNSADDGSCLASK